MLAPGRLPHHARPAGESASRQRVVPKPPRQSGFANPLQVSTTASGLGPRPRESKVLRHEELHLRPSVGKRSKANLTKLTPVSG
ncbi:unnamed protein product [Calypogeia fissa]